MKMDLDKYNKIIHMEMSSVTTTYKKLEFKRLSAPSQASPPPQERLYYGPVLFHCVL